jgi:hypothetical protein
MGTGEGRLDTAAHSSPCSRRWVSRRSVLGRPSMASRPNRIAIRRFVLPRLGMEAFRNGHVPIRSGRVLEALSEQGSPCWCLAVGGR